MPRYRVNVPFGPWGRGDEFESGDPLHAAMAAEGRLLVEVREPPDGSLVGVPPPLASAVEV